MKNVICLLAATLVLGACASNPNRATKIDTVLNHDTAISGEQKIGIKDGDMVVQRKVLMSEDLRRLQYDVYGLEDHVYGSPQFGSRGLHGVLKDCRANLASKENGGDGKLTYLEPIDRVTDKEDDMKIGLDETDRIVGVSEEYLKDRIARFRGYKQVLEKRQQDLEMKLDICTVELKSRQYDHKVVGAD